MEPVRCAVIGVGMMGASHVGVLNGLTSANLIGCCDVDLEVAVQGPRRSALLRKRRSHSRSQSVRPLSGWDHCSMTNRRRTPRTAL